MVQQTDTWSTVLRGGGGSVRIYGFRRDWKIVLEKGFGFCTGVGRLWGSSGLQERQRYWYRSTGSLGFQHLGLTKGSTQGLLLVLYSQRGRGACSGVTSVIGGKARVPLGFGNYIQKRGTQSFEGSGRRPESKGLGVSRV